MTLFRGIALTTLIMSANLAMAQDTAESTNAAGTSVQGIQTIGTPTPVLSSGFRIGFIKGFYDSDYKRSVLGASATADFESNQNFGIKLGYAKINSRKIGFLGYFSFNDMDLEQRGSSREFDSSLLRFEGNATLGITDWLYGFGGLNLAVLTVEDDDSFADVGLQAGFGLQITKNWGLDIAYSLIRVSRESEVFGITIKDEITFSGGDITLHGTF